MSQSFSLNPITRPSEAIVSFWEETLASPPTRELSEQEQRLIAKHFKDWTSLPLSAFANPELLATVTEVYSAFLRTPQAQVCPVLVFDPRDAKFQRPTLAPDILHFTDVPSMTSDRCLPRLVCVLTNRFPAPFTRIPLKITSI